MEKELFQALDLKKAKILYDSHGEPEFALVPLKDRTVYALTEEQIVAAVDEVRNELFREQHGSQKTDSSS